MRVYRETTDTPHEKHRERSEPRSHRDADAGNVPHVVTAEWNFVADERPNHTRRPPACGSSMALRRASTMRLAADDLIFSVSG